MPTRFVACRPSAQRGIVLIVVLIMLVIVTLVVVSSVRSTTLDERMAGNSRDRDKALQAAEAVVRQCLTWVTAGTYPGAILTPVAAGSPANWDVDGNWAVDSNNSRGVEIAPGGYAAAGLAADPRCMVEQLNAARSYRVTGRAVGGSAASVVVLQATYSTE